MDKVFISFKNSVDGVLTEDSKYADELYEKLQELKIDCFYSNITLAKDGVDNYMKRIETEIAESKIMVVVATNKDYISDGWVRQEWLTFLNLSLTDGTRKLFTYVPKKYLDNKSIDDLLPPFLRPFQSFKSVEEAGSFISKSIDFTNDLSDDPVSLVSFWDNYFGIFNKTSSTKALDILNKIEINVGVKNALIGKFLIENGNITEGIDALDQSIAAKSVCGYYLRGHYYITGKCGFKSLAKAKDCFSRGLKLFKTHSKKTSKILILLYSRHDTLTKIFYCTELLYRVLKAYKVKADVVVYSEDSDIDWAKYQHVVTFINDESINAETKLCSSLKSFNGEKIYVLNNILEDVCPKFIRKTGTYQCDDLMITRISRTLIGIYGNIEEEL